MSREVWRPGEGTLVPLQLFCESKTERICTGITLWLSVSCGHVTSLWCSCCPLKRTHDVSPEFPRDSGTTPHPAPGSRSEEGGLVEGRCLSRGQVSP